MQRDRIPTPPFSVHTFQRESDRKIPCASRAPATFPPLPDVNERQTEHRVA